MPVGSIPYLIRSGLPVLTLRSSFLRSSSSGTICSQPRRIRASCSSTDFTLHSLLARSYLAKHLTAPDGIEGVHVVCNRRLLLAQWPTDGQHVKSRGII